MSSTTSKSLSLFLYRNFSESASTTFSMRWSTRSHRSIYQWIWSNVHMQLVSLLQRCLSSTWWYIYSHRSTHQWIWSNIHVQLVSLLQWHHSNRSLWWASRFSSSESASMTSANSRSLRWASWFPSSESASMTSANSRSLRWASRFLST